MNHLLPYLHFCDESCQIIMLLPRKKDKDVTTAEKWCRARHYFVNSSKQWLEKVRYCQQLIREGEQGRIYSTYNSRSLVKGANNLQRLIGDGMVGGNFQFMMRGKGLLASCLKKQGSMFKKDYFMLDIDTKDVKVLSEMESIARKGDIRGENCFIDMFPTPNGYHMLVKPMDIRVFDGVEMQDVELKRDEFLFIDM